MFPLKNATAEVCSKVLINEYFLRFGFPRKVISDNGPQFISQIMQQVADVFNTKQSLLPKYHPEANHVEREKS